MYKYALYALGNAHDAEDVVAETFLEAFRGISKLREADAFKGWIFKILSIRIKRRISRYVKEKNQLQIEDFAADSALRTDGMDSAVIARTDLLQALTILSPQERMILSLSVLYGYTTKQISQMLRCPHGTVSSKLHRSLQKLKTNGREVIQMSRSNPAEDFSQIKKQLQQLDNRFRFRLLPQQRDERPFVVARRC